MFEVSSICCLWTYPTGRKPLPWSNVALKKQFSIEHFRCLCCDPTLVVSRAIKALDSLGSSGSNHLKAIMFSFRFDIRRDRALWRQDQFVVVVAAVVAVNKQFLIINNCLFAEHTITTWWHSVNPIILSLINFNEKHLNAHTLTDTHIHIVELLTHVVKLQPVCVHKTVLTCQEHKHLQPACLWPHFTHLIRVHTNLFVNSLQQNTHTHSQNHKPIYRRLTHQVKNAVSVVFTPCSATQKHYKSHKPLTVCGALIAAEWWIPPGSVCACVCESNTVICLCRMFSSYRKYEGNLSPVKRKQQWIWVLVCLLWQCCLNRWNIFHIMCGLGGQCLVH